AQFGKIGDVIGKTAKVAEATTPWTPEQETAIGQATAAKMISMFGLYEEPALMKYVNLVGQTVARQAPRPVQYKFAVLDSEILNAFALPGGYIFVTRGTLANLKNEAELAGVLAHEVAHVDNRHVEKQVRTGKLVSLAAQEGASHIPSPVQLADIAKNITTNIVTSKYSRDKEEEADRKGTEYATRAGYNPLGLRDFLQMLSEVQAAGEGQRELALWGTTHPPLKERVAKLTKIGEKTGKGQELAERYTGNVDFAKASAEAIAAREAAETEEKAEAALTGAAFVLSVKRNYNSWDNPLHTELSINDVAVNIFTSETIEPIAEQLKEGWNTITLKTTPQEPANQSNGLIFRIGRMKKDEAGKSLVMEPVVWEFRNDTDWKFNEATQSFSHPLGPKVKEVTISYRIFNAGMDKEGAELNAGDYVLIGKPMYSSWNSPVVGTVWVNGTPLNSFLLQQRSVVITPLLKKGRNEIKLVSTRVKNSIARNDIQFEIAGPAEWNVAESKYTLPRVVQFNAMQGWVQDPKSGQLIQRLKPAADEIERVVPFLLKAAPAVAAK
ncbi:MAG: M48 family metalloprotease, partial [Terriglobales bacterium]